MTKKEFNKLKRGDRIRFKAVPYWDFTATIDKATKQAWTTKNLFSLKEIRGKNRFTEREEKLLSNYTKTTKINDAEQTNYKFKAKNGSKMKAAIKKL